MTNKLVMAIIVLSVLIGFNSTASAHDVFQDVLKEQYTLKSFSCKACHPDGDNRKIRTPFAERIYQQMKDKGFSEQFAVAEKKDEEAKKANPDGFDKKAGAISEFEKVVAKEFKVAFVEVAKQSMTIDEIFKEGLFNGARLDTKAIEAAKNANAEEEKK